MYSGLSLPLAAGLLVGFMALPALAENQCHPTQTPNICIDDHGNRCLYEEGEEGFYIVSCKGPDYPPQSPAPIDGDGDGGPPHHR